jgi:hypothetical protein
MRSVRQGFLKGFQSLIRGRTREVSGCQTAVSTACAVRRLKEAVSPGRKAYGLKGERNEALLLLLRRVSGFVFVRGLYADEAGLTEGLIGSNLPTSRAIYGRKENEK